MSFADAGCILKVDFHCESCRYKLLEVLSSVIGVYNIDLDGDLVKITGEVDPNRIFKAVARTGNHAKIVKASFKHPSWDPYNSTSLDYHQLPMDYGHQYHPAMFGRPGFYGQFPGNPGFSAQFYRGPGFGCMHDGADMHHPFGVPTMHGGRGFPPRRHPTMGPNGPWYPHGPPPQAFGDMHGVGGNCCFH